MPILRCIDTGKTCYLTRRDARAALNKLRTRREATPERHAYNCVHCGKWHITRMGEKAHRKPALRMEPAKRWRWNNGKPKEE